MIIRRDIQQGSALWHAARAGIPTASELGKLVKQDFTPRKGDGVDTYILGKAIERFLGRPLQSFGSWATEQGNILEEKAWPTLEFEVGVTIERVGFCTTDDKRFGCSPDGIIWTGKTSGYGVEIKGLQPVNHARILPVLDEGGVPEEYLPQIHGGMHVTGFLAWYFYAFSQQLPTRVIKVERDEKIQRLIGAAVDAANERIDTCYARLCALQGSTSSYLEQQRDKARAAVAESQIGSTSKDISGGSFIFPGLPPEFSEPANLWKGI